MTPQVLERTAARVVLVDRDDRVLLIHGHDPARPERGWYWFTPGGGLEPGETLAQGAVREVQEETGLVLPEPALGPVVAESRIEFGFEDLLVRQHNRFFVVRVDAFEVDTSGWEPAEQRAQGEVRWWPRADLATTAETVYPEDLLEIIGRAG